VKFRARLRGDALWSLLLAWSLFALFRVWQATTVPALVWPDSKDYETIGSHALWSGGFWFGSRPVLAPLLWMVTRSPAHYVLGQAVVSVVVWGFLAWTVAGIFPDGWRRFASFTVVLAFATSTPIALWDRSVLSESLAMSGVALLFAVVIRFVQRPTPGRAIAVVGAALWCALARDSEIVVPTLLGLLLLGVAVTLRRRPQFKVLMGTGCALLLAAGFCISAVIESGRDNLNITNNMYVRVFPYPKTVAWFASHGMPESGQVDRLARMESQPPMGTAKAVFPNLQSHAFARLGVWITDHGAATYGLWMATHPWDVVLDPLRRPERTFNDGNGDLYAYAAGNRVTSGLTPVFWPGWVWLEAMVAFTLVIGVKRKLWRNRVAQAIVALGVIGLAAMIWAWNGDGQEVTRHTVEGLAQVHLGALLAVLVAIMWWRKPEYKGIRSKSGTPVATMRDPVGTRDTQPVG